LSKGDDRAGPDHLKRDGCAIGNGVAFARGWDFSAWLGLVPKQMSTGDRTILGRISKRGNGINVEPGIH
jgi:Transposase IS116/IS110/IS902 family